MNKTYLKDRPAAGNFAISLGIGIAMLSLFAGAISFWQVRAVQMIHSSRYGIAAGALLILYGFFTLEFTWRKFRLCERGFAAALVFLFFTDWLTRRYNFLQEPWIRGEIILCTILSYFLLRYRRAWPLYCLLPSAIALLFTCFYVISDGALIYSDDHPVFFYRLGLLKENFPRIPVFNPLWSGGRDTLHLFATGSLNVFFLAFPLIYSFELASVYNFLVASVLFLLVPGATFFAARVFRFGSKVAIIAATLALTAGTFWYRWGLTYGTMGFVTSTALLPLNLAFVWKVVSPDEELSFLESLIFVLTCSLMLCWSPSGLVFVPAIVLSLIRARTVFRKEHVSWIVLLLFLINIPWIVLFWSGWNVSTFLQSEKPSYAEQHDKLSLKKSGLEGTDAKAAPAKETKASGTAFRHKSGSVDFRKALKLLRQVAIASNPLILLLAIPGIFALGRSQQQVFAWTAAWLFMLGTLLVALKPQLELDRMLFILTLCCCLPAAKSLVVMFCRLDAESPRTAFFLPAFAGGFLLTGILNAGYMTSNRGMERFHFARGDVAGVEQIISENAGDSRTLFSGFVLHDLSRGHVASLVLNTRKPILASSHLHERWTYTEIFPREALENGDAGIEAYLDLYNVSLVAAHEWKWISYFQERVEKYHAVGTSGKFEFFLRNDFASNYFKEGGGEVLSQTTGSLELEVSSENALIKFRYFPSLESSNCNLSKEQVMPGLFFIRLSDCNLDSSGKGRVLIRSKSFWQRLKDGLRIF